MRAQNEPPERVLREPTGGLKEPWPQSRGSQLAGTAVGAQPGERVLDLCAAPGGKATQLAAAGAEVVAVEKHPGRARELEENAARLGAALTVVNADALELPAELDGFDRVARGRAVLRPRRTQLPPGSALARPPAPGAPARPPAGRGRARAAGRVDHLLRLHDQPRTENEDVVDALGLPVDDLGAEFPEFRHPRRPEFLLTLPHVHRTSGFFVARLRPSVGFPPWPGATGCGRSRSSRRSTRPTSFGLGEQIDHLLGAGARVFHFDVGDGHFVEPVTIGPIVLQSISPLIHKFERRRRLPPHGQRTPSTTSSRSRRPAATASRSTSRPARSPGTRSRSPATHDLGVGVAFNPETPVEDAVAASLGADLVLCMSIHPGYSGQEFMPESARAHPRRCASQLHENLLRPGRRRRQRGERRRDQARPGREAIVAGQRDLRPRGLSAGLPPARASARCREPFERALELAERGRGTTHPNPVVGAVRRRATARSWARAGTSEPAARTPRSSRSRRRASGRAARRSTSRSSPAPTTGARRPASTRSSRPESPASSSARRRPEPEDGRPAASRGCGQRGSRSSSWTASPTGAHGARTRPGATWIASRRPVRHLQGGRHARRARHRPGLALGDRRGEPPPRARAPRGLRRRRGRDGHRARGRPAARRPRRRAPRASRAGSRSAADPSRRARSSSSLAGPLEEELARAGRRGRPVAPARRRADARHRVPPRRARRQAAALRRADARRRRARASSGELPEPRPLSHGLEAEPVGEDLASSTGPTPRALSILGRVHRASSASSARVEAVEERRRRPSASACARPRRRPLPTSATRSRSTASA